MLKPLQTIKRLTAVLLLLAMLIPAALASDFNKHWARPAIEHCIENAYMSGYPDGSFQPDRDVTRAELSTILCRLANIPTSADHPFADVPEHEWYNEYIGGAYNAGIVNGMTEDSFQPEKKVTRQEAAVMLGRLWQFGLDDSGLRFKDSAQVSSWAVAYVASMTDHGILNGDSDGNFNPAANITRAEICQILLNKSLLDEKPSVPEVKDEPERPVPQPEPDPEPVPEPVPEVKTYQPITPTGNGNGTEKDPFVIRTYEDMKKIGTNTDDWTFSKHYILANDIILMGQWSPLASDTKPFKGSLNGNGYTIKDMMISSSVGESGLFKYSEGTISNLHIEIIESSGLTSGGLVAVNNGVIKNCSVKGNLLYFSNERGGISAINRGTILNCFYNGVIFPEMPKNPPENYNKMTVNPQQVTLTNQPSYSGGIAGINEGTIENCYTTGTVYGTAVGGIAGANIGGGAIINCYTTSAVIGINASGGIVGFCGNTSPANTIKNCVALNLRVTYYKSRQLMLFPGDTSDALSSYETFIKTGCIIGYLLDPLEGVIENNLRHNKMRAGPVGEDFALSEFWYFYSISKSRNQGIEITPAEITSRAAWEKLGYNFASDNWQWSAQELPFIFAQHKLRRP